VDAPVEPAHDELWLVLIKTAMRLRENDKKNGALFT
jgi:hypothetical protein